MTHKAKGSNLKRRGFLRGMIVATLGAVAGGSFLFRDQLLLGRLFRRKPNIIFILADDLGYGDLGSYGQPRIQTLNLDAMAAQGMRFTQCYAGSTVCAPSRCCLMTGLHTGHARIRHNVDASGERVPLRPQDLTVAELLKSAGYVTGVIGKWGLGDKKKDGTPNKKGFDEWFGYLSQRHAHDYYPEFLWRNEEQEWIEGNQDGKEEVYSHDLFTQEALNFIRAHQDEHFFLYLAYTIPHENTQLLRATGNGMQVPSDEPYTDEPWPQVEKNFAAMITRMDRDVGRIESLLKELGLDRNTVVFFSSDNGPYDSGGHSPDFFKSAGPLRGRKYELYDAGIRVPMIVRWPGVVSPGIVSSQVWAFWDFLPTVAEIAAARLPEDVDFDGISMLPALLGKEQQEHEFLYWEFFKRVRKELAQAVRMGDWKGVRDGTDADIELYNLQEDIGETHDVADEQPEIVAQIAEIMQTAHTPSDEYPDDPDLW